ncbi:MAG: type II secretion system major pseudopilin GspG [Desulfobacterales bacterium]|nr:type II secretion system major pseudopilin GspG [Desulfobacteraceae bacterium]MDH3826851.1 type II secretion system major pseudopilin GspG [Desulfobacterales bacterium]
MQKHKRNTTGFTLIELLIVMVIIGLLAAFVAPRFFGQEKKAKQRGAKGQIALLESALDTYRLDVGRYPSTEQGLEALREQPDGIDKWDGPYLRKELPVDPWGNPYVYESPSEHGDYAIVSYGADGKPGGEEMDMDIVSWKDIGK